MNKKVADHMKPGSHGSTFGGNPVCCAGALAVLDEMDDDFLANGNERAAQLLSLIHISFGSKGCNNGKVQNLRGRFLRDHRSAHCLSLIHI